MPKNLYDEIIQLLESVKQRPFSFIGPLSKVGTPTIRTFLDGVHAVCWTLDIKRELYSSEVYEHIIASRGWSKSSIGVWVEMREKGKSEEEITNELLDIEIELWKRSKPTK